MLFAERCGGACRQEQPRKDRHVDTECILVEELVFGGELDIAETGDRRSTARSVIGERNDHGELQVFRTSIVEVDACLPARVVPRRRAGGEGIDLIVAFVCWFRIVGDVWRSRDSRRSKREQCRARQRKRSCVQTSSRQASCNRASPRNTASASSV